MNHLHSKMAVIKDEDGHPVDRLFGQLLDAPDLLVRSGQSLGYRNKITYNVPIVEWSDLAEERLNDVCRSVQCWHQQQQQQQESTPSLASSATTIREVMVKVSRQDEFMVRVTVEAPPAGDVQRDGTIISPHTGSAAAAAPPVWSAAFRDFLLTRHPQIVCLCFNVMSMTGAKPMKDYDSYRFLTPQRFLVETKPTMMTSTMQEVDVAMDTDGNNGGRNVEQYCRLQISPDTFSEVNTMVEDLQFRQKKIWLEDEPVADVLLVSGRDICSFGLSYRRRIDQHVVAVQHDPLVHRDAVVNLQQQDSGFTTVLLASKATMVDCLVRCPELANARSVHCVTTGGRHGMNPTYLQYLVAHEAIQVILYNSCNTKSLVRDMRGFLTGGFYVADFRSYDLFPGTRFTASVTKLKRRPRTLLLPIGPAGVGKTTLTLQLERYGMTCFHRDARYAQHVKTLSGKATRRLLHTELLQFLEDTTTTSTALRMVDSTNGDADGRRLYVATARAQRVVLVNFRCDDVAFLLHRTRHRLTDNDSTMAAAVVAEHPFFPTTVAGQREKHERILKGLQYAERDGDDPFGSPVTETIIIDVDPTLGKSEVDVFFQVYCALSASQTILQAIGGT